MNLSEIIFRLSFVILNLVVMVGGIILIIMGSVLISTSSALLQEFNNVVSGNGFNYTVFLNSAIILIIVGLVLLLVGVVGIIGAIKHKIFAFILMGYMVALAVIVILQVVGVILAFVYQAQVVEAISGEFGNQIIVQYGDNATGVATAVDLIQVQLQCCGFNDTYRDYTDLNISIPISCSCTSGLNCVTVMNVTTSLQNNVATAYGDNCVTAIVALLNNRTYQYVLGGIGIAFLVFEIAVILFALCLIFMDLKEDD